MMRSLVRSANLAALCLLGWTHAALVCAQSPPRSSTAFEVASLKQLEQSLQPGQYDLSFVGTSGKPFQIAGNRVTVRGTLHAFIGDAYGIKDYQVAGLPSWADRLLYTVTAKAPGNAELTQDEVRPLLQALLVDRFRLQFHRETKELRVYHMVQSKKSGLFQPAAPGESFSWKLTPGPGGTMRSKATKESIGDFVQLVGVSTDRPVMDRTGITGDIDYDILISLPEGERRSPEDTNRAIVYAVVDQLGLKLESAKDAIETLVVDRVEPPTEN
ncbi:MAG: TIGR03435 family protein [Acidobacteriia bacterium]|nr:TIGR03435 family protein [Terriglobia bacterium]